MGEPCAIDLVVDLGRIPVLDAADLCLRENLLELEDRGRLFLGLALRIAQELEDLLHVGAVRVADVDGLLVVFEVVIPIGHS